ncbi:hypothetical protein CEQ90_12715 [Lewinellaceae bacterium SD302]|nr:hypothetical protein CEQ90_12715 [Lewinellaceae bacterium SD302]
MTAHKLKTILILTPTSVRGFLKIIDIGTPGDFKVAKSIKKEAVQLYASTAAPYDLESSKGAMPPHPVIKADYCL